MPLKSDPCEVKYSLRELAWKRAARPILASRRVGWCQNGVTVSWNEREIGETQDDKVHSYLAELGKLSLYTRGDRAGIKQGGPLMNDETKSFPMLSTSNWWKIRDKFQTALPTKVTTSYLISLLDLKDSNSASSNVLAPMRALGLVDSDGEPTDLARAWRLDDSYEEACNEMLDNVYPRELLELLPEREVDKTIAQNWFMKDGIGKAAAQKMTRLFALLKEADLSKKAIGGSNAKPSKVKEKQSKAVASSSKKVTGSKEAEVVPSRPVGDSAQLGPNLHIDLQIHISPESTPEQIEAIFSSMAKHLYKADGR